LPGKSRILRLLDGSISTRPKLYVPSGELLVFGQKHRQRRMRVASHAAGIAGRKLGQGRVEAVHGSGTLGLRSQGIGQRGQQQWPQAQPSEA